MGRIIAVLWSFVVLGFAQRASVSIELNRTAALIKDAQKEVKRGKRGSEYLAKAIGYQRYAVRLYRQGRFNAALNYSMYARDFAMKALRVNNASVSISIQIQLGDPPPEEPPIPPEIEIYDDHLEEIEIEHEHEHEHDDDDDDDDDDD